MPATLLSQTLLLTAGCRARMVNVPAAVRPLLAPLPDGVHLNESGGAPADWLILFVKDRAALDAFAPVAVSEVAFDGVLWIAHPAHAVSDAAGALTRDTLCAALEPLGFDPVAEAPINEGWTALRFRPRERLAPAPLG